LLAPPILFAVTIHEYAHALVAFRLGDPTAKASGRLTLNPISHLDPLGTLMLFIAQIGWAKPVPVDPRYFRNPKRDMLWVALAGPASNLLGAFTLGLLLQAVGHGPAVTASASLATLWKMGLYGLYINVVLAVFNLLPIPPLDGSKILMGLLPPKQELAYVQFAHYGPLVLVGLIVLGRLSGVSILGTILSPFVSFFLGLFGGGLV